MESSFAFLRQLRNSDLVLALVSMQQPALQALQPLE
jgi:hypothetical protein